MLTVRTLAAIALLWAAGASTGHAAFQTADRILRLCESQIPVEHGLCLGYIEAAADALNGKHGASSRECTIPDGVKATEIQDAVVKALRAQMEAEDQDALPLVSKAISDAWPCRGK